MNGKPCAARRHHPVTDVQRDDLALNVQMGEVQEKTTARHTSLDFVRFLGEVMATRITR